MWRDADTLEVFALRYRLSPTVLKRDYPKSDCIKPAISEYQRIAKFFGKRRRAESNRRITDLQSAALATWLRRLACLWF